MSLEGDYWMISLKGKNPFSILHWNFGQFQNLDGFFRISSKQSYGNAANSPFSFCWAGVKSQSLLAYRQFWDFLSFSQIYGFFVIFNGSELSLEQLHWHICLWFYFRPVLHSYKCGCTTYNYMVHSWTFIGVNRNTLYRYSLHPEPRMLNPNPQNHKIIDHEP